MVASDVRDHERLLALSTSLGLVVEPLKRMLTRDLSLAGHGHDFDLLLPSQGFPASLQVLEVEIRVAEPYVVGWIHT